MMIARDAMPEDARALAGVHVRSWQAAYRGLIPDDFLDGLSIERRAAGYELGSSDPDAPETIIAAEGEVVVGFASIGRSRDADAPQAGELYALYVDPLHWAPAQGAC
jgi:hypothetical protein